MSKTTFETQVCDLMKQQNNTIAKLNEEIKRLQNECGNCPMLKSKNDIIEASNQHIKALQIGYAEAILELKAVKSKVKEYQEVLGQALRCIDECTYALTKVSNSRIETAIDDWNICREKHASLIDDIYDNL